MEEPEGRDDSGQHSKADDGSQHRKQRIRPAAASLDLVTHIRQSKPPFSSTFACVRFIICAHVFCRSVMSDEDRPISCSQSALRRTHSDPTSVSEAASEAHVGGATDEGNGAHDGCGRRLEAAGASGQGRSGSSGSHRLQFSAKPPVAEISSSRNTPWRHKQTWHALSTAQGKTRSVTAVIA